MANRKVTFELDADEAKALDGFRKIINVQKKAAAEATAMGQKQDAALTKSSQKAGGLLREFRRVKNMFIGATGGVITVGAFKTIFDEFEKAKKLLFDTRSEFEKTVTPLLSLGSNAYNIQATKDSVLKKSGATGFTNKSISDAQFDIESGMSGASDALRKSVLNESIELAKLSGDPLKTINDAIVSGMNISGDQFRDVNHLQNYYAKVAEQGKLRMEDIAQRIPEIMQTAKPLGVSPEEIGSMIIEGTQQSGSIEKTMTSIRNLLTIMATAEEKTDMKMSGDLFDDFKVIQEKLPKEKQIELFGRENFATAAALFSNPDSLEKYQKLLQNIEGDEVKDKLQARYSDPSYLLSESVKQLEQQRENAKIIKGDDGYEDRKALSKRGVELAFPGLVGSDRTVGVLSAMDRMSSSEQPKFDRAYFMPGAPIHYAGNPALGKSLTPFQSVAHKDQIESLRAEGFDAQADALVSAREGGGLDPSLLSEVASSNREMAESNRELAESNRELIESNRDRSAARSGVVSGAGVRVGGQRPVGVE